MIEYILVALIVGLFCLTFSVIKLEKYYIILPVVVILSVFVGLRDLDTGTDTERYSEIYQDIYPLSKGIEDKNFGFEAQRVEIGFVVVASIFKELNLSFNSFLVGIASISIAVFSFAFTRVNIYPFLCIFLYTCTVTFLSIHFNIIRQGVAASFGLLAISYLLERRWLGYFVSTLIAISFHTISVFYLLIPIILKFKWRWYYSIAFLILVVGFYSINTLGIIVDTLKPYSVAVWRVGRYLVSNAGKELNLLSLSLLLDLLLILYLIVDSRYLRRCYENYDVILSIFSFGFLLMVFFHELSLLSLRIGYSFFILEPILFMFSLQRISNKNYIIKSVGIILLGFVWFLKNLYITAQFL